MLPVSALHSLIVASANDLRNTRSPFYPNDYVPRTQLHSLKTSCRRIVLLMFTYTVIRIAFESH